MNGQTIKKDEQIVFELRSLYEQYGYVQYKMNKFEEYELYVRNKDFLVSNNVITFTDTDGKLMALKPDVTLSIIKNGEEGRNSLQKVYYNENVYRVPKVASSFKEIMQAGLECIGEVGEYEVLEVLLLSLKSLEKISSDFVLDISDIAIVSEIMDSLKISDLDKKKVIKCFSERNAHDLRDINGSEKLIKLISAYGNLDKVKGVLEEVYEGKLSESAKILIKIMQSLENAGYKDKVRIDFSVLNDMNYYSGVVFKGFISGIPTSILSGGEYDYLMQKMGRKSKAIGFAVYLDLLEGIGEQEKDYDVDVVVIYDQTVDLATLSKRVNQLVVSGKKVLAIKELPTKLKYREIINLSDREGK